MKEKNRRILILAEGLFSPLKSKTANGAIAFMQDEVIAVIDSTKTGTTAQKVLGYGRDIPVIASLEEGIRSHPTHLLIGIAPRGGRLPETWREMIRNTLKSGVHILSGLHTILSDDEEFYSLASKHGVTITDYRKIPPTSEVVTKGSWKTRKAKVILTVGTDCNIGKMTTILRVQDEFNKRGLKSDLLPPDKQV